ncbi:hypothetical protein LOC68_01915 [Blastopirellula sp. JC732]|uniref:ATP-grasp domain-containing protein n=1 Tax=Blastopirellula sediminis TaxID=2894196 RepID=A0A9X1MIY0_9BACT|nr:hypothetical protein [Blastopirellula sediminis]MCC9608055.1 hypothetical protein [Blastopirellula sediminis]MCC9627152.1 hypothetical protein [Blastopirellula sediminis]
MSDRKLVGASEADARKVVLILGNRKQTLTVVRTLRRSGWKPLVGFKTSNERNGHVCWSRDAAGTWPHTDWDSDEQLFAEELIRLAHERPDLAAIYPIDEEAILQVRRVKDALPPSVSVVLANEESLRLGFDKQLMHETCTQIGMPVAEYRVGIGSGELQRHALELGFPCIVKPLDSAELVFGTKAAILRGESDLQRLLKNGSFESQRLMIQRLVNSPRYNIYFAAKDGKLLAAVNVLILETDRADGTGFAVSVVTMDPPQQLREDCENLVRHSNYTGLGCGQWLTTPGKLERTFLELNPRLGGNFRITERAGVPLSLIGLQLALGHEVEFSGGPWSYLRGVRFAWSTGALAGCRYEWKRGTISNWQAISTFSRAIWNGLRAHVHATWQLRDPVPTLVEIGDSIGRLFTPSAARMTPNVIPTPVDSSGNG